MLYSFCIIIDLLSYYHKNEDQVKEMIEAKSPEEKKYALKRLVDSGNFFANMEVSRKKEGRIKVTRISSIHPEDYIPCPKCLAFLSRVHKEECFGNRKVSTRRVMR